MFEHLDDPTPFRPSDAVRARVKSRGRRLRLRRRLAATAGATTLALCSVTAGAALYVDRRDDAIDRVEIAAPSSLDGAVNVLVIGSDARSGPEAEEVDGERADTIALVRIFEDGRLGLLSIPRDLAVPGPGGDRPLSAALDGGTQQLVDTVVAATGLPVDHVVRLDMQGLADVVDAVGGVEMFIEATLRDPTTGLDLQRGCVTVDGDTALALARSRHVEGDPSGDLGRMTRARALLFAVHIELTDITRDPAELNRVVDAFVEHATLDEGLSVGRIIDLLRATTGSGGLEGELLPVTEAPGDVARWQLAAGADEALRTYGATDPPTVPPDAAPPVTEPTNPQASWVPMGC